jgi:hypothetical protein
VFTYRYPRTQRRSGDQRSRLRRTAGACSWPCRCGHAWSGVSQYSIFRLVEVLLESEVAYWTMSARMGALKTLGKGWVFWLAAPSAPMMVTVGRDILTAMWLVGTVRRPAIVDSSRLQKVRHFLQVWQICGRGPCSAVAGRPFRTWQAVRLDEQGKARSDVIDLTIMDHLQLTHENHNYTRQRPFCGRHSNLTKEFGPLRKHPRHSHDFEWTR